MSFDPQQDLLYLHTALLVYKFTSDLVRLTNGACATLFFTVYTAFCKSQRLGAALFYHDNKGLRSR